MSQLRMSGCTPCELCNPKHRDEPDLNCTVLLPEACQAGCRMLPAACSQAVAQMTWCTVQHWQWAPDLPNLKS